MSYPAELDAQGLHQWAARTVEELTRRRADINSLNVFPVPDSDTGSNMLHTMESALEEADKCTDPTAVAEALAIGSVRGARGNSGMVLSQVLRGVADATTQSRIDGHVLAAALGLAVDLVDRALATPVEGTIITILRAAAEASKEASLEPHAELYGIAVRALEAARVALKNTPSQLPALREAGVVDAGGAGLVILLECLLAQLTGEQPAELPLSAGGPKRSAVAQEEETDSASAAAEIEVVFFYDGELGTLEEALKPMGNSLVIARSTEDSGSVHIHSANAGAVIEKAFSLGSVSGLRLEALPAGGADHAAADPHGSDRRRIFAVAPEGAAGELFAKVGADVVKPGASVHGESDRDLFLPNGFGGEAGAAAIIPTHSLVAGLAAMSVYEPGNPDTAEVVAAMGDAATSMRVIHPAAEKADAVETACATLLAQGGEQVTVLTGLDLGEEDLAARLGVDVAVLRVPGLRTEIGVE
ncbi:DAK2 domain-containing protein [uncultured Corynebacterium sp.]|uniref:DAK2 domain-containing protein n=1 Tax=uncultured Corynebacterium sp. TaxID=159447 RepID=UPI0025DE7AC9|nr:DAK2 domain-containing protein [uncultured Corynebacterium sp.]